MTLPIEQRVAAARELLRGWTESEFEALSIECQVNLMEAIEYLDHFEDAGNGGIKK